MKKMLYKIAGAILILINTAYSSVAQSQNKVTYMDEKEFSAMLDNRGTELLKSKQYVSLDQLTAQSKGLVNNQTATVKINLPKPLTRKKILGDVLFEKCKDGVLIIGKCYNCGRCHKTHSTSIATAFVIAADGVCVTNYHVLADLIGKDSVVTKLDSLYFVMTMNGRQYPLTEILAYSKESDLAVFKVDTKGVKIAALPLGEAAPVGAAVRAITHPNGHYYYYSEGIVSRNIKYGPANTSRMEITADYAKGSSGGPIFDETGAVVGIVSTTSSIYYEEQDQKNLQMVVKQTIPISSLKALIPGS